MISEGLLSIVEEQLDLTKYELWQVRNHRVDFDFYVTEGRVDFTNGNFVYFTKEKGGVMRNLEQEAIANMYPTILSPEEYKHLKENK